MIKLFATDLSVSHVAGDAIDLGRFLAPRELQPPEDVGAMARSAMAGHINIRHIECKKGGGWHR